MGMVNVTARATLNASLSTCAPEGIPTFTCCMYNGNCSLIVGYYSISIQKLKNARSNSIIGSPRATRKTRRHLERK